ncbi:MAG: carbohydrate binding family 9 domain-containing protein [Bacteroidetes bacterium]|nr:carbohydrate binding family 9 domain-containing protein [Bacteroidota bacterium]
MRFYLCFVFALTVLNLNGQKEYTIKYSNEEIKIDGVLEEQVWLNGNWTGDFVMNYPNVNGKPSHQTQCQLIYTEDAIYFAAKVYDHPDSISYFLTQRDNFGNGDYVGVTLDTYGNSLNAFAFYVTAAGVELDALVNEEEFDYSWNAVWKSRVGKFDNGWTVEMRIPYSALRFPEKEVQTWNINFERQIRRTRESSFWSPVDPNKYGVISQSGRLLGLENIKPPLRLSFSPYGITYLESVYDPNSKKQVFQSRTTGGVDLKWGISDAFTLDMTLVPDFGQTVSDNQILNLGPFEVQFAENRAFFKEGTDLFGIGDVFYSRRIGAIPYNFRKPFNELKQGERVVENTSKSPLVNATKISGRTTSGLGIGVFNAVEGRTFAMIEDSLGNKRNVETNPLTNYNVTVFSQNLVNNGRVSILNTNVSREGSNRDANVTVANTQFFSEDRNYTVQSTYKQSTIFQDDKFRFGHVFFTSAGKVQGRYNYSLSYYEESDTYDPNDLGFLMSNNSRSYSAAWGYKDFIPKGRLLRKFIDFGMNYKELYSPSKYNSFNVNGGIVTTFKNFLTCGVNGDLYPFGFVDHFESRMLGVPVNLDPSFRLSGFYSSDYSKPLALDVRASRRTFMNGIQSYNSLNVSPRFQFSSRFFLVYSIQFEKYYNDFGFVAGKSVLNLNGAPIDHIVLGTRDRDIVTNSIFSEVIFSKRMGMEFRLRHYWQKVNYLYFSNLKEDGNKTRNDYFATAENGNSVHNRSFNAFTIDVNYKWVFYPGCEFLIFFKNNIFSSLNAGNETYLNTFETLFENPQINSVSAKFLIFVDVLYFKGKDKQRI